MTKRLTIKLTFKHATRIKGGKLGHIFQDESGEERVYISTMKGSELAHPLIGGVYEVETEGESIYPGSAKFLHRIEDKNKILAWQAEDKTIRAADRAAKAHKRDKGRDFLEEQLEPVRQAYRSLRGAQRAIYLARIVTLITR